MNIKRNCIFLLDKEKGKSDAKIRYRVRWNGNTVAFGVGYRVDVSKWSTDTQRCKNNTTHGKRKTLSSVINKEIAKYEKAADDAFSLFERDGHIPTGNEFRKEFSKQVGRETERSLGFFDVFDQFVQTQGFKNNWTTSTKKKFATIKKHLLSYDEDLSFGSLTEETMYGIVSYLLNNGMINTTIDKYIVQIKWFLRWAFDNGFYKGNLHNTFKPHLKGTSGSDREVIYLEWDELMQLYNFQFEHNYLSETRDVFCFCCFTGLRYSDVARLKKENITEDSINIVTQKTSDRLKIELNKYSKSILDKYSDRFFKNNLALPIKSNQKMNEYLKKVGMLAGLDAMLTIVRFHGAERIETTHRKYELISTHCGRRTFVVNALYLGIPSEVIMKWTGHSDYRAMKPYVAIIDDLKRQEMDKFNKR